MLAGGHIVYHSYHRYFVLLDRWILGSYPRVFHLQMRSVERWGVSSSQSTFWESAHREAAGETVMMGVSAAGLVSTSSIVAYITWSVLPSEWTLTGVQSGLVAASMSCSCDEELEVGTQLGSSYTCCVSSTSRLNGVAVSSNVVIAVSAPVITNLKCVAKLQPLCSMYTGGVRPHNHIILYSIDTV